jgi:hypothetical protein
MSQYRAYFVPTDVDPSGLVICKCVTTSWGAGTGGGATSSTTSFVHTGGKCSSLDFNESSPQFRGTSRTCSSTTVVPDVEAPIRDDDFWNTTCIGNNCYGYACNDFGPPTDPGTPSGNPIKQPTDVSCKGITDRAISDGFVKPWGKECPPNYRLVYLVVDPGRDYHWYRRDPSGFWSHKTTGCRVSEVDGCGNKIHDPSKANHDYRFLYLFGGHNYEKCGYLCAPN